MQTPCGIVESPVWDQFPFNRLLAFPFHGQDISLDWAICFQNLNAKRRKFALKGDVHFEKGLVFVLLFIYLHDHLCGMFWFNCVKNFLFFFKVCLRAVEMGSLRGTNRKIVNSEQFFFTVLKKRVERMFVAVAALTCQKWHPFVEANAPHLAVVINEEDNYPKTSRLCSTENIQLLRAQGLYRGNLHDSLHSHIILRFGAKSKVTSVSCQILLYNTSSCCWNNCVFLYILHSGPVMGMIQSLYSCL